MSGSREITGRSTSHRGRPANFIGTNAASLSVDSTGFRQGLAIPAAQFSTITKGTVD
jgi:hypothetical protein